MINAVVCIPIITNQEISHSEIAIAAIAVLLLFTVAAMEPSVDSTQWITLQHTQRGHSRG